MRRPSLFLILLLSLTLGLSSASPGFAASSALRVNLDQWANEGTGSWQNGDLNGSNSAYAEGDVVPFRLALDNLPTGTHTVHLNWDVTAGGHAAYDFLASYNATESPGLCLAGGGAVSDLCPTLPTPYSLPFFTDNLTIDGKTIAGAYDGTPRVLTLYGVRTDAGHLPSFGTPSYTAGHETGDVVLTFETNTSSDVLLAWGGHIARTSYWGPDTPKGAGMVSGAPWHMRTQQLDSSGNKNQDRSIQTSALPAPVITVVKYNDLDGNGSRAASGEPGLAGWTFALKNGNQTVDTKTTAADGTATFSSPNDGGTFSIVETLQAGWTSTDPGGATPTKTFDAPRGATTTVLFGNRASTPANGTIRVFKYNDANGNGTQDTGELGLTGWSIDVLSGTTVVGTITTGSDGNGSLSIAAGTYTVAEQQQSGWTKTQPTAASYDVTVVSGQQTSIYVFGNQQLPTNGTIRVFKYNDANGNGTQDTGELGLTGWSIDVLSGTTVVGTITTGSDGNGSLSILAGTYTVAEQQQSGWTKTQPTAASYSVTVTAGQQTDIYAFGNQQLPTNGTIRVLKYEDVNSNHIQDTGELGLADWKIDVLSGTTVVGTITTGSDGNGSLSIAAGTYTVAEQQQSGWTKTQPTAASYDVTVVAGQQTSVYAFGNHYTPQIGTIRVLKYNDLDANGSRAETGENGLSGWQFTVILNQVTAFMQQILTTDAQGIAEIDLAPGDYRVCESAPLPAYWSNTDPGGTSACKTVTVTVGQTTAVSFGNHYAPPPPPPPPPGPLMGSLLVTKYSDTNRNGVRDPGETGLAGWTFEVRSGSVLMRTMTTDASGAAVTRLSDGSYTVTEITQSGWTSTDPGGTIPVKTVSIVGEVQTSVMFGNAPILIPPTSQTVINIVKYVDTNANGVRDNDEPGGSAFTFVVRDSAGNIVRTAVSGADGSATLLNLPLGTYAISEQARDGWVNTDPGGAGVRYVTLTSTATYFTIVFGNAEVRLPSTATDDGPAGTILLLVLMAAASIAITMPFRSRARI